MTERGLDLLDALEPAQLTAEASRKLPRAHLGRLTVALLVALRIYVVLAVGLVGFTFVRALLAG